MMGRRKIKVLVVEDERLTAKSLCLDLKDIGCDVLNSIGSGEEAVEVAVREKPHLIFMDIRLAGKIDGIEAAKKILANEFIPICFISGFSTDFMMKKANLIKPVGFLEKPVTIAHMAEIVEKVIEKSQRN